MFKKCIEISLLAAKNIFTRGSNYFRVYRAILILGLPYLVADFSPDVGDISKEKDIVKLLDALNQPVPLMDLVIAYLIPLSILLLVFWFWEMFLCINPKNVRAIKLEFVERIYLRATVLLFVWYVYFLDYFPYPHGPDLYPLLFVFVCLLVLVSGMILTLRAARDRKTIFWIYLVATLMTTSYLAIPSLAKSCYPPPNAPVSGYGIHNPIERIWKYCF